MEILQCVDLLHIMESFIRSCHQCGAVHRFNDHKTLNVVKLLSMDFYNNIGIFISKQTLHSFKADMSKHFTF